MDARIVSSRLLRLDNTHEEKNKAFKIAPVHLMATGISVSVTDCVSKENIFYLGALLLGLCVLCP